MKKYVPTVTVAVSAHNEEQNIAAFLTSILTQREEGFFLKEIRVYSDGSIDKTVEKARTVRSSNIKIYPLEHRVGKSTILNRLYQSLTTDLLVQSDADVVFSHPLVIFDLIQPLLSQHNVWMTAGRPEPLPAVTFTEKAVNASFEAFRPIRAIFQDGHHVHSTDGRILAFRTEFVRKIHVPHDMIANDAYTYLCCKFLGHEFRRVGSAIVLFRSPQTLKDQIRQNTRFLSAEHRMTRHFPSDFIRREYEIPKGLLGRSMVRQWLKHPVLSTAIFFINRYCEARSRREEKRLTAKWPVALTTKHLAASL